VSGYRRQLSEEESPLIFEAAREGPIVEV
jgi:hypothetical protein